MINNVLLDTNVILRYLLNDHLELSAKSSDLFEKVKNGELKAHISRYIIVEIVFVLTKLYSIPKKEVVQSIVDLLNIKSIIVENKDLIYRALELFDLNDISIVDAILACESHHLNIELITYDKKLNKIINKS